jgi:hypothetical protein
VDALVALDYAFKLFVILGPVHELYEEFVFGLLGVSLSVTIPAK